MRICVVLLLSLMAGSFARAGEIPLPELRALERAIESGLDNKDLGSQTIGELQRLRDRLERSNRLRSEADGDRIAVLAPLEDISGVLGEAADSDVARLEREAADGKRSSLRSLALYRLYRNNPEEALRLWRRLGETNPNDLAYRLMASYLELSLGEYERARTHLEAAERLIGARSGLGLSEPVFCDNIAGYRLYARRRAGDLMPGDNTLVYVEIEGADFHSVAGGDSECRLMFGLRVKNEAGTTMWADPNYGEYAPIFNGPIRDLHTALTWRVPNDLTAGVYTLVVEAVEESSKRRGESSLEFTVSRRPTNPETRMDDGLRRDVNRALQDAGKMFPGSPSQYVREEGRPGGGLRESDRYFELLRQHERQNRGTE